MPMTSTEFAMLPDLRTRRAQIVTASVLNALHPWIERLDDLERHLESERKQQGGPSGRPKVQKEVARALQDLFFAIGIEIVTDADRIAAGLPQRNDRGLTDHEMAILESRRIKVMLQPNSIINYGKIT